jgi:hypothetical protein
VVEWEPPTGSMRFSDFDRAHEVAVALVHVSVTVSRRPVSCQVFEDGVLVAEVRSRWLSTLN